MLTEDIRNALKGYTAGMQKDVALVLQAGDHEQREELTGFLNDIASVSPRITVEQRDFSGALRSPLSFTLESDGRPTGIVFSGIPGGHEFNSLVLAILQAAGTPLKLDQGISDAISAIDETLKFEVFVSLGCHNCPDVVQALNQFALLNDGISTEMIDGGLYAELVEARNIQGVPAVFLNGEVFANGKVGPSQLLEKLLAVYPPPANRPAGVRLPLQDVTVIGGGPAGVSAAIYAARKGLKVTLVADRIGGQVKDTMGIENFISVPGTTGPGLTQALARHMQDYDITVKEHLTVESIHQGDDARTVELISGEVVRSRTVIIATGAKWRELGVPGEKENLGSGVAYCPHCDGPFFKGKHVAVIGGGNSGIEAALDLAGIVKSVTVLEFQAELKADRILVDRALARDNVTILKNVATRRILAHDGRVHGIEYLDRASETLRELVLEGVFVQIGLVPNSGFVKGLVDMNRNGEISVNERGETSAPGVFACGDVTTVPYKQIIVAMSEGSKAALAAFEYLLKYPAAGDDGEPEEIRQSNAA